MGSDIQALQVRQSARKGGDTYLSSILKVYNDLVISEPAALSILFSPTWPIQVYVNCPRYDRLFHSKLVHDLVLADRLDTSSRLCCSFTMATCWCR
jgi:hypothetical protein